MGYRHDKDELLAAALAVAHEEGLSRLTYGRVAGRLGISDRMVVYYFPSKDDLVSEVLTALGTGLQQALAAALTVPAVDHRALTTTVWPLLASPQADPVFALFFEANGLATTGLEPYRRIVRQLVDAWIGWTAEYLTGSPEERRAQAEATVALLDGLLLLRQVAGPATAGRAAAALGVA